MKVVYDNSFEGLFSLIFDYYNKLEKIEIEKKDDQINFLQKIEIKTSRQKFKRVKNSLIKKFGKNFYEDLYFVFKSDNKDKEKAIALTIKGLFKYGFRYLNSSEKSAILFRAILQNYLKEVHSFKGLTRFKEIQENILFAKINPHNDIIELLSLYFVERLPNERFVIYDENRKSAMVYENENLEKIDIIELDIKESQNEEIFQNIWRKYYKSASIKERENKKLMVANMPKKYWKNLVEKQK